MYYIRNKIPIDFGEVQRSSEDNRGQRLKTLFTQYLNVRTMDLFYTYMVDVLCDVEDPY